MSPGLTVSTVNMVFCGGMLMGGYFGALGMWTFMLCRRQRERADKCENALRSPEYRAYLADFEGIDYRVETYEKPEFPGIKFLRRASTK